MRTHIGVRKRCTDGWRALLKTSFASDAAWRLAKLAAFASVTSSCEAAELFRTRVSVFCSVFSGPNQSQAPKAARERAMLREVEVKTAVVY